MGTRSDQRPRDKGGLTPDSDQVRAAPTQASLDSLYGAVPALKTPLSDGEMTAIAAQEHADEVALGG